MDVAAGPELAGEFVPNLSYAYNKKSFVAAVTNAGGMGVIGGLGYTPRMLRSLVWRLVPWILSRLSPFL